MSEHRKAPLVADVYLPGTGASIPARDRRPAAPQSQDTRIAVDIRDLAVHGRMDAARERFAELVTIHQRRALRIAYQYLHDAADADEVVQDAFLKVFSHIGSYREAWPFEVWFTRILINGCLDRRKARLRRARWFAPADTASPVENSRPAFNGSTAPVDPESRLLARERRARLAAAIHRLDGRQRTIFMLTPYGD